ncbi:MAG: hypothetical protein IPL73_07425 [Candidatus Obscuribacter sp.]|nr:hypothetical protein [Candidatus Obscuribacter sp.]
MDKIIGFIRNNASLTVVVSLCIIPLILMFVQKQTPNAKNLSVTATVLSAEPRLAGFNLVVTNNDTVPFTYYMASTGTGMPSHNFKATVTTGDTVRTSLNRAGIHCHSKFQQTRFLLSTRPTTNWAQALTSS